VGKFKHTESSFTLESWVLDLVKRFYKSTYDDLNTKQNQIITSHVVRLDLVTIRHTI